jgi:hypothetical protein
MVEFADSVIAVENRDHQHQALNLRKSALAGLVLVYSQL